jgi:hypothetical protein
VAGGCVVAVVVFAALAAIALNGPVAPRHTDVGTPGGPPVMTTPALDHSGDPPTAASSGTIGSATPPPTPSVGPTGVMPARRLFPGNPVQAGVGRPGR